MYIRTASDSLLGCNVGISIIEYCVLRMVKIIYELL